MVTYYNRKDMVDFGRYLLSKARTEKINNRYLEGDPCTKEERLQEVYSGEIEEWALTRKKNE